MIRPFAEGDLDQVMEIWLAANLQAHSFVPAEYWEGNLAAVRRALPQAEVYVCQEGEELLGFLGLEGDYLAGIFVRPGEQSRGLGRQLLDRAKEVRDRLGLNVYQKNVRALSFYRREGFRVLDEGTDRAAGERELRMVWDRER